MIFYSLFKTLIDREITIECKNDVSIRGILVAVDQWLNMKLEDIKIVNDGQSPDLYFIKSVFIRGNVVRYVHLAADDVDTTLLQDATRTAAMGGAAIMEVTHARSSHFVKGRQLKLDCARKIY